MEEYADRNALLNDFGFKNYDAYLRSSLWKSIRGEKLAKDPECYGCGRNDRLQVHHGKYHISNLTGQSLDDLYTVCSRCHHKCEITAQLVKCSPSEATKHLERIRAFFLRRGHIK